MSILYRNPENNFKTVHKGIKIEKNLVIWRILVIILVLILVIHFWDNKVKKGILGNADSSEDERSLFWTEPILLLILQSSSLNFSHPFNGDPGTSSNSKCLFANHQVLAEFPNFNQQDEVFTGSDYMTLISKLWGSDWLTANWLLTDCQLITYWLV